MTKYLFLAMSVSLLSCGSALSQGPAPKHTTLNPPRERILIDQREPPAPREAPRGQRVIDVQEIPGIPGRYIPGAPGRRITTLEEDLPEPAPIIEPRQYSYPQPRGYDYVPKTYAYPYAPVYTPRIEIYRERPGPIRRLFGHPVRDIIIIR